MSSQHAGGHCCAGAKGVGRGKPARPGLLFSVGVSGQHPPAMLEPRLALAVLLPAFFFLFSRRSLLLLSVAMSVRWPVVESLLCACAVGCSCGACAGCSGVSCLAKCTRQLQVSCTRTGSTMHACRLWVGCARSASTTFLQGCCTWESCTVRDGQLSTTLGGAGFALQQFDCVCLSLALCLSLSL